MPGWLLAYLCKFYWGSNNLDDFKWWIEFCQYLAQIPGQVGIQLIYDIFNYRSPKVENSVFKSIDDKNTKLFWRTDKLNWLCL